MNLVVLPQSVRRESCEKLELIIREEEIKSKKKKKIKKVPPELRSAPVSPEHSIMLGLYPVPDRRFCYSKTHFSIIDHEVWLEHVWRNLLSAASSPFKAQRRADYRGSSSREAPRGASTPGEEIEMSAGITMAHADSPLSLSLSVLFLSCFCRHCLERPPPGL